MAYTDGVGQRHFVSSGIPHSPIGTDSKDTARKRRENRVKAQIQASQMETISRGSKRVRVIRKRFEAMVSSARDTEAEQSGVTLRRYFDDWVAEKLPEVGTSYASQLALCKREFFESLGTRADEGLVHVDEEDISEFVDYLENRIGGRSINKRLSMLNEMFGDAEKSAFVVVNPVEADHFREETPFERRDFSTEQTQLILAATRIVDWQTAILLGCYCGMRLGDARSQTWEAIDLEKRIITWVPEKTKRKRKCKAKIMITPIHAVLYEHLVKVRAMSGDSQFVTPSLANRPKSNLSDDFIAIVLAAKIDPIEIILANGRKVRLLTFHSLKHEFATQLKRTGAPDKEWTRLTGHSVPWSRWNAEPISKVAQMYNHVDVEDLRKWIDLLSSLTLPGSGPAISANEISNKP